MAVRLSRSKLAGFVADQLVGGMAKADVLKQLAAYLIETGRTRELELLVRDIKAALSERGITVADVTSAHPLTDLLRQEITTKVDGGRLQLRETIDESVLGGIRIDLPGRRFDGTIARRLNGLKAKKV